MEQTKKKKPRKPPSLFVRIKRSALMTRFMGFAATNFLRLVYRTSTLSHEPPDGYETFAAQVPVIITMWHGQHLMIPFVRRPSEDFRVMISKHRDGEINAIVCDSFGIKPIRASAARKPSRTIEKGGLKGFFEMKAALAEGVSVAMTADLSNVTARQVGLGIIMLARSSGRPIQPIAVATSRFMVLKNWDRTTINLPFSKCICVFAKSVTVAADADDALLEVKRLEVQNALNEATDKAYHMLGAIQPDMGPVAAGRHVG